VGNHQLSIETQTNATNASSYSVSPIVSATTPFVQGNEPENPFIAQAEESIRQFTNISDQNLTFKSITNESYSDFYEFDFGNSSFWVNNITARVQSASLFESGSKSQKEIIDLDQGSIIAESYAKEKYPELWNVSEIKRCKADGKKDK
jgi:hypothetical protein